MQPSPATPLPAFDQAALDRRFLTELARLLDAEAFASYAEWAATVGVSASTVAGIAAGRYHCSLKLLYNTLRAYPTTDFNYVVLGSAVYARPEPTAAPLRQRGRPRAHAPAA
jgi:DNA-binding XRE family transcriptional regulator